MGLEKLGLLMKTNRITSERLSKLSGVRKSTIDEIVSGVANPSFKNMVDIAKSLNLTIDELTELLGVTYERIPSQANLSTDSYDVAVAYKNANIFTKDAVRKILDLSPLLKTQAKPTKHKVVRAKKHIEKTSRNTI